MDYQEDFYQLCGCCGDRIYEGEDCWVISGEIYCRQCIDGFWQEAGQDENEEEYEQ